MSDTYNNYLRAAQTTPARKRPGSPMTFPVTSKMKNGKI